jgi:hypothetical protein
LPLHPLPNGAILQKALPKAHAIAALLGSLAISYTAVSIPLLPSNYCEAGMRCAPPLPEEDIERIVDSISARELRRRGGL